jgi:hypothetical protein
MTTNSHGYSHHSSDLRNKLSWLSVARCICHCHWHQTTIGMYVLSIDMDACTEVNYINGGTRLALLRQSKPLLFHGLGITIIVNLSEWFLRSDIDAMPSHLWHLWSVLDTILNLGQWLSLNVPPESKLTSSQCMCWFARWRSPSERVVGHISHSSWPTLVAIYWTVDHNQYLQYQGHLSVLHTLCVTSLCLDKIELWHTLDWCSIIFLF